MNNKTQLFEQLDKEILIGLDKDNNAVTLELRTTSLNPPRNEFTISGNEYDMNEIYDEEKGQERQKDYVEDYDYLWKEAVANDQTTLGLEEWKEDILDQEDYTETLGDMHCIDYDNAY